MGGGCIKLKIPTPDTITLVWHGVVKVGLVHVELHIHVPCAAGVTAGVVLVSVRHVTVDKGEAEEGEEDGEHPQLQDHGGALYCLSILSRTFTSYSLTIQPIFNYPTLRNETMFRMLLL